MIKVYSPIKEVLTLEGAYKKDGRNLSSNDLGVITDAALVADENKILWVGKNKDLPLEYKNFEKIDLSKYVVTPELVDSHTHLVFGGNRAFEHTLKLEGKTYEEIFAAGGGIHHSVDKTRALLAEELFQQSIKKIEHITSNGVGTIEIKTGYGLSFDEELKLSKVIDRLKKHFAPAIQIINTSMSAHAVPKNFKSSTDYINEVSIPLLHELKKQDLIDFVDIFFEKNYFNEHDVRTLFEEAKKLHIPTRIHADELNNLEGATLASELKSHSADHLLMISDKGVSSLAKSSTVATLLPGTALFLNKDLPPARKLLDAGAKVAIASDFNPGSCHFDNLLLIASISGRLMKMRPVEIWAAITLNPTHSLNLKNQGAILPGLKPRLTLFECDTHHDIFYNWSGINRKTIQ